MAIKHCQQMNGMNGACGRNASHYVVRRGFKRVMCEHHAKAIKDRSHDAVKIGPLEAEKAA